MIDGVIKYQLEHVDEAAPEWLHYEALEALRARLFTLGLIGEQDGVGYGNLSIKGADGRSFFITSTQTGSLVSLEKEQYTFISDYDFSCFKVLSKGSYKPSSEALSHAMIYEVNSDIAVVIHIHSKPLWHFMKQHNMLATTADYGTAEMVQEIAKLYQDRDPFSHHAFVMLGHEDGVITFGRSIQEAELALYAMIRGCLKSGQFQAPRENIP